MRITRICTLIMANLMLFAVLPAYAAAAATADTPSQRIARLATEARERWLDLSPVSETMGAGAGPRQDRLELMFTDAHRERQREHHRWVLRELETIPLDALNPSEKLTHQLLARDSREGLEWLSYPFHQHYIFVQMNGGVANNLINLVGRQPFRHEADYQAWLRRLQRYPLLLDGAADVMREGMAARITIPRALVERALLQLDSLAPNLHDGHDIANSSLWKPVLNFPAAMDAASRQRFEADYRKLLADAVFPAIRRLSVFVRTAYLPHARTSDGIGALPQGAAMYRLAVKSSSTTELSPDEIHALGVREVERIQKQFLAAGARAGFMGPMADFGRWLRATPENCPFNSGEQVIEYLYRIHARIVPQLPRLFGRFPKARFEIRLTDAALAASMPAQWYPPSDDGTRPGIFAMPVVNPRTVSRFGLEALLAHEGMPGHHFDGGIKLESDLPEFRRRSFVNAFGEGWALYAEKLGHELGLYEEPLALMGRYSYELFRACRLVVDTGLHAKDWPRERAIRYLVDECGSSPESAASEVLRYMAWPGQALGYKIGELTLLDIRAQAEQRLGARFDIRAFHDALLAEGHLPLTLARERMAAWVEAQAQKP